MWNVYTFLQFIFVVHAESVRVEDFETQCLVPKNELIEIIVQLEDVANNMRQFDLKNGNTRKSYTLLIIRK